MKCNHYKIITSTSDNTLVFPLFKIDKSSNIGRCTKCGYCIRAQSYDQLCQYINLEVRAAASTERYNDYIPIENIDHLF